MKGTHIINKNHLKCSSNSGPYIYAIRNNELTREKALKHYLLQHTSGNFETTVYFSIHAKSDIVDVWLNFLFLILAINSPDFYKVQCRDFLLGELKGIC